MRSGVSAAISTPPPDDACGSPPFGAGRASRTTRCGSSASRERAERLLIGDDLGGRDPARAGKRLLVLVDPHAVDLGEQPDARPEHLGNPVEVTVDEDVARPGPVEERPDERRRQLPVEYPVPV